MLEASDAGFEIRIYKTLKPEAVLGVALPVQGSGFGINELLGSPFEIKDLVHLPCKAKN
jgi:homoserine kinase